jgi:hypothetical protein
LICVLTLGSQLPPFELEFELFLELAVELVPDIVPTEIDDGDDCRYSPAEISSDESREVDFSFAFRSCFGSVLLLPGPLLLLLLLLMLWWPMADS